MGIFVGACIVSGNINGGFKNTVENYILNAIADVGHAYVYLFTFFLSGVVAMMEKSGGMIGFTRAISKYATTARGGQVAAFAVGCIVFFDDYANTLLVGQSMRPLMDSLFVSREKLAFFVDATAAPIARSVYTLALVVVVVVVLPDHSPDFFYWLVSLLYRAGSVLKLD